ncbi:MAG: Hydrogenase expression/formation protein HypE [Syntrophorhabdus sp. PtaU1.Bin050]|nr:MAG: Hydrogenase expression/formation protein HypE [Syntrophorhabdus sp. PtaU1.Bin050]
MASSTGNDVILLAHGDGGLLTHRLLEKYFLPRFDNRLLHQLTDAASFPVEPGHMAITTDAFVVDPIFFPAGDIGKLAVCGTVNDLAVSGAKPLYLAASFIIEEGFPLASLERIVASMAKTCAEANVVIVAGDTKVVGRGQADKIYITTTGVGYLLPEARLGYQRIEPGDFVIINGPLGNHGLSILLERGSFDMDAGIVSDCAPLNGMTERLIRQFPSVKFMRDLTRGGFATNAKEIALQAAVDLRLDEKSIPIDDNVKGITDILGLDPLYLANEGKFLAIISKKEAGKAVDLLQNEFSCTKSCIIGTIDAGKGDVFLKTELGGTRRLNMLTGAPLPRIC